MARDIKIVGVVGLGTMGAGIVEVFAKAGLQVVAVDGTPELADRGRGFLTRSLDRAVSRGKLEAATRDEIVGRVTFADQLTRLSGADLVIEAVPERMEIKNDIFATLDGIIAEDAILASNTSSLSLTEIAAHTRHPSRVIGMHFFNPAPVLALVEVITTLFTDDELSGAIRSLAERLGKQPVVVSDRAGFVANALLITYLARAIRTYETGHVSREDLDNAGKLGIGLPMGPLTLCDLIGLDVIKEVCDVLYNATHDPAAAPPALLTQMVIAGRLGRKTGRGFYTYEKSGSGVVTDAPEPVAIGAAATSIAVVGAGEVAADLVKRLESTGASVTALDDPTRDTSTLAGVPVVMLTGGPHGGADCGHEGDCTCEEDATGAWFSEIATAIDRTAIVVPTDDQCGWIIAEHLESDTPVVPARLHVATRTGQIAEVASGLDTDPSAVSTVDATLRAAGLTTIVARDRAGLVVDALLYPHLNAAVQMLDSGYASATDIDTAMTAGCGYPKGPFAMIDEIGADEVAAGLARMHGETNEQALAPAPLLIEHAVAAKPFLG
ncbi:3-hydroxybutyryl-CoA dehydrogenase [Leekyejoonella antrihumi]|uniref:3-hydroxyacyl-CoA dehydrogenase n=1 Tax=Leekyejoonella antrihumi TaxID=1660198 RepID=A0A563E2P9_9MICO|nr:3-hydroxybutyryl-CoA dehydrogenase [Leekyejoonella antrihumi]TWP36523.1 3-hydroxyacyl-CoA dehydrogenase [Leekyejoonella antrihumi]